MATIEIGSKAQAGKGEDHDTGTVLDVSADGAQALVAWDGGAAKMWTPVETLTLVDDQD